MSFSYRSKALRVGGEIWVSCNGGACKSGALFLLPQLCLKEPHTSSSKSPTLTPKPFLPVSSTAPFPHIPRSTRTHHNPLALSLCYHIMIQSTTPIIFESYFQRTYTYRCLLYDRKSSSETVTKHLLILLISNRTAASLLSPGSQTLLLPTPPLYHMQKLNFWL